MPKAIYLVKSARSPDILILFTCFFLTVVFDMVVAVTVGVLLAAVLFMNEIANLTTLTNTTDTAQVAPGEVSPGWQVYKVKGPLFFAAADRVFGELAHVSAGAAGVIVQLEGVPLLDAGGTSALVRLMESLKQQGTQLILAELQAQPERTLGRARIVAVSGELDFAPTLKSALESARA